MVVLNGTFDGKQIVLDHVPEGIPADTRVRVIVEDGPPADLSKIAELARPGNKPRDFAAQHEHYVKGSPRK